MQAKTASEIQFKNNNAAFAEWFHQHNPVLTQPKGYNLWAVTAGVWNVHYRISAANYGMRAEMGFYFRTFISNETEEINRFTAKINPDNKKINLFRATGSSLRIVCRSLSQFSVSAPQ